MFFQAIKQLEKFLFVILVEHFDFVVEAVVNGSQLVDNLFLDIHLSLSLILFLFAILGVLELRLILRRVFADKIGQLVLII